MQTETVNAITWSDQFIDRLTGLPGQNSTADMYRDALDRELPVLFIDIDDFKAINSVYSYTAGDCVMKDLGQMIRTFFPDEPACRKGGDEFIVVFESDSLEARKRAYEFIDHVGRFLTVKSPSGGRFAVTISAGFAAGTMRTDASLPACEHLVRQAKLNQKNCMAMLSNGGYVFRRGPRLSPTSKKYIGEYAFVQSKQLLEIFRWYNAAKIGREFTTALNELLRMMNEIVS